jgi:hypothetical protein
MKTCQITWKQVRMDDYHCKCENRFRDRINAFALWKTDPGERTFHSFDVNCVWVNSPTDSSRRITFHSESSRHIWQAKESKNELLWMSLTGRGSQIIVADQTSDLKRVSPRSQESSGSASFCDLMSYDLSNLWISHTDNIAFFRVFAIKSSENASGWDFLHENEKVTKLGRRLFNANVDVIKWRISGWYPGWRQSGEIDHVSGR